MNRYNNQLVPGIDGFSIPDTKDMECQVLADLISNPDLIPTAQGIIKREMFSVEAYQRVWDTIVEMVSGNVPIDMASMTTRVERPTILELLQPRFGASYGLSAVQHCEVLAQLSTRRLVYLSAWEMMRMANDNGADFNELISRPGALIDEIAHNTRSGTASINITQVLNDLAETIESNQVNGKRTRVPSGFAMLDTMTYSGFNAGNLVILSARPSVGKTAIMLQMALSATRAGIPATIFSLEMTNQELAQRLLFSTGMITPAQVATNAVNWTGFETASGRFCQLSLYLNDMARTLDEICNNIMLNHQRGMCDIAFIDYLGLMRSTNPRQTLYQAIAERTMRLKQVAKECHIPIVLLSQLNRNSDSENRPPELYDLRDCGSIEQDADIVLMLERASRDLNDSRVNMWVRKNRQGKAGNICIELMANETFTEFHER